MITNMTALKDLSKEELIDLCDFLRVIFAACQIYDMPLDLLLKAKIEEDPSLYEIVQKGDVVMDKVVKITAQRNSGLN